MHTYVGKGFNIHHNSDLSGDVEIVDQKTGGVVSVSGPLIVAFLANWIRHQRVCEAESISDFEALGISATRLPYDVNP